MRIAVTGASGFLGRHLLAAIVRWRMETDQALDIVATARRLRHDLPRHPGVEWLALDLATPPPDPFATLGRPDVLIHLAWEGLPNYQSPHHLSTELPRQRRFLEAVVQGGLPALLVAGSCAEYGRQQGRLAEDLPARPVHPYAVAKDTLRCQLEQVAAAAGCRMTWLRIFYLFGDGQPERTLYSQLMRAIARGEAAFDMSTGDQVRDYVPVGRAAAVICSLTARLARGCEGDGIVNLASGRPQTVRSLVRQWVNEADASIRLNCGALPYLAHEPMALWGDATKLERLVGNESGLIGPPFRRAA
jgi:nucleoside-diphosphate-sugar epimerase